MTMMLMVLSARYVFQCIYYYIHTYYVPRYRKRKNLSPKTEVTFVGVHNRRTDYLEFRRKRLGLDNLYEDYFEDAMEYYREDHDHPVFLYVSDDMEWGNQNLKSMADGTGDIFFVGCGNGDDVECIGEGVDLAYVALPSSRCWKGRKLRFLFEEP